MFIIIVLGFFALCLFNYCKDKRITIALVYSLMWLFLSSTVWLLELPKNEFAFAFVLANVFLFSIGHTMFFQGSHSLTCSYDVDRITMKETAFIKINTTVVIINILALIYLARYLGFSLRTFININQLMGKMNSISSARYSDGADYLPLISRMVNSIVYAVCGYNGFFSARKIKRIHFYNLVLVLIQTILTNTKATLVFGFAFWTAGYLTGFRYFNKKINFKICLIAFGSVAALVFLTTLINFLRHAGQIAYYDELRKIISAYFIGPYSAFSIWISGKPDISMDFGANTFSCVFRLLGIAPQVHGEFVYVNGIATNVYTVFKHLLNDYSYIGTLIIALLTGVISARSDTQIGKCNYNGVGFSIVLLTCILVAFFSSLFRYTTNMLACALIIIASLPVKVSVGR